jgi:hypothetical protein
LVIASGIAVAGDIWYFVAMPRSAFKHPALATQEMAAVNQQKLAEEDEKDLEGLDGWVDFTPLKKKILAVLPWWNSPLEAYRYVVGNPEASFENLKKLKMRDHKFRAALGRRQDSSVRIARNLGTELLGKAVFHLDQILESSDTQIKDRLKAIDMVFHMNNFTPETKEATGNVLNYQDIQMNFNAPPAGVLIEDVPVERTTIEPRFVVDTEVENGEDAPAT